MEAIDYKQAETELRKILSGLGADFAADQMPNNDYSERGTLRFSFALGGMSGEWSCGSAIPLHAYVREPFRVIGGFYGMPIGSAELRDVCKPQRVTLWVEERRIAIRRAYRPNLFDVVSSLLLDDSTVDGFDGWEDWAHDFGMLQDATPDKLRELQVSFALIRQRRPMLRRFFGDKFERAQFLASQL